jgi:hypothetical protein
MNSLFPKFQNSTLRLQYTNILGIPLHINNMSL